MSAKILLADPIDKKAFDAIKELAQVKDASKLSRAALLKNISSYEILIVRSRTKVDEQLLKKAKKLKAVVRAGVGLDNIDVEYCNEHNLKVVNTPEAPTISVAELTIGLMLSLLRKIPYADATTKNKKWLKSELTGKELFGKTLGIIGFGRIGPQVAQRAKVFRMEILIFDKRANTEQVRDFGQLVPLQELLRRSDIITLHIPLTDETENMISDAQFKLMKNGAYLINTARGPIVNEQALIKALKSGKLAGAALDVYWGETPFGSKIMQFKDKLILMPHIGSQTYEAQARVGDLLIEKVRQLIAELK
ncbi:TPA: hydroxyacid dehydrogenase [archaeon]|uniref:Hydroxyacid dehydrogenase n=1 Tax=Candidatus Naiadarchaeum limnaeum TaxID=2756139 RepID=A0A832XJ34_9ARCH|nr:hydroxyacid dehydrogenase [Candidatus Naiadarchaeum limnaeum]